MSQNKKEVLPQQRLEKLFSSNRDLTLGRSNQRSQTNKKSFAPNLVKKRSAPANKLNDFEKEENERDKNQRNNNKKDGQKAKRFNNQANSNLVQTTGFLSEGIAVTQRKGYESLSSSRDTGGGAEHMQKPKIIKSDEIIQRSEENEQLVLSKLIGEDQEDEKLNLKQDEACVPIKIKNHKKRAAEGKKKLHEVGYDGVKIKLEPSEEREMGFRIDDNLMRHSNSFLTMERLIDAKQKDFMIIQLPDTLPGRLPEKTDNEEEKLKMNSAEQSSLNVKAKPLNLCSLNDVEEGVIGKIVRYKSGKTKLLLGESEYNIEHGLSTDFQQSIFTVNTCTEERSANFYNFGSITSKLTVSPDWEWLFTKI